MKSSKSNKKISVAVKEFFLRHPHYDLSATLPIVRGCHSTFFAPVIEYDVDFLVAA